MNSLVNHKAVREQCRRIGCRCGRDFCEALEQLVMNAIYDARHAANRHITLKGVDVFPGQGWRSSKGKGD